MKRRAVAGERRGERAELAERGGVRKWSEKGDKR